MKAAVFLARLGNKIISLTAGLLIVVMLLYGGYSLWDTAMLYKGAFTSGDLLKYKPDQDGSDGLTLARLKEINPEVCGWLTVDETNIDYPVVQGKTDMDYINKDVYGEFSLSGSIFLDSRNTADFSDGYNLIYGHHMANGAMFGNIVDFTKKDYFGKHGKGSLYLPDGSTYAISFFACIETDAFDEMVYLTDSWKEADLSPLLGYVREKAVQYRDIGLTAQDKLVALSTCAEAETNGRVILFGRLKRND